MPHLSHVGNRGVFGNGSPSTATTRTVATTAEIPAGAVVLVRCSSENPSAETGETARHTLADSTGLSWERVGEWSQPQITESSHEGVTVSMWWTRLSVALPASTTITVTFADGTGGGAISVEEYDAEDPGNIVTLLGWSGAGELTSGSSPRPWAVILTLPGFSDATWIGAAAHGEGQTTVGLDSSFTTDRGKFVVNGGNNANNTSHWGQYRKLVSDTETWNGTLVTSTRQYVAVLAAFLVEEPPAPPPEGGVREYRAHFETESHGTLRAVTDRRPDAVIPDPRICTTTGPVAVEDLSQGLEAQLWRFRAEGNQVFVQRQVTGGWSDEELLTTATGEAEIVELDAAFDGEGRVALCAERPTGDGDAPQVWVYWFDPRIPVGESEPVGQIWWSGYPGRTPRIVNDYVPPSGGPNTCPPDVHVQLFAMEPGAGMTRRVDDEHYATPNTTVLADSSQRYLQRAFRTTDRRVSVRAVRRVPSTGRYVAERVDSLPLQDSLLRRPIFTNWTEPGNDVMRGLGSAAVWMASPADTSDFVLRVTVQDACDAIEVGASATYPTSGVAVFDQQEQSSDGGGSGYTAGGHNDFTFSIDHGGGSCSLVAFRARCRKVVADQTCYSPWRYVIIPAAVYSEPSNVDIDINCDRDLLLAVTDRLVAFSAHGLMEGIRETDVSAGPDPRPFVCGDPPVGETPGYWFVGGSRNFEPSYPFPTHFKRYAWRVRGWQDFHFADDDGLYIGTVIGDNINSGGGSSVSVKTFDWISTRFPVQFPDDSGLVTPLPVSLDVLGMV